MRKSTNGITKRATANAVEVADPLEVRAIPLRAAASVGRLPAAKTDDAAFLNAARSAQHEAGSFRAMHDSVKVINGLLELLHHVTDDADNNQRDVNWLAINDSIADARDRMEAIYSATSLLAEAEAQ